MKDSTSATRSGAELVLRRFLRAILVWWPVPLRLETLSYRWLHATEEELLPFPSPPREKNVPEILGREHFDQERVYLYYTKRQEDTIETSGISERTVALGAN